MKVIGHRKAFWYLLKSDTQYFLDVNSGNSFVGYSIGFELFADEVRNYLEGGEEFITELAYKVNNEQKSYLKRSLDKSTSEKLHSSILSWNKSEKP